MNESEKPLLQYVISRFDLKDQALVRKYTELQDNENEINFPRSLRERVEEEIDPNYFFFVIYAHITTTRDLLENTLLDTPETTDLEIVGRGEMIYDPDHNTFEIVFAIRNDFQNKGLATIFSEHLLYQAHKIPGACCIFIVDDANLGSQGVMRKLGEKYTISQVPEGTTGIWRYEIKYKDLPTSSPRSGYYELTSEGT